ncbi:MAG: hypothetical protein ACXW2E_00970 [Nitrososphaeraceae archaeon]
MSYVAFVLDERSRANLLRKVAPIHPNVICHHVTLRFGVHKDDSQFIMNKFNNLNAVNVRGIVADDKVQALIVDINGNIFRSDGSVYHVTHSIDRAKGAKPVDSNKLLEVVSSWKLFDGGIVTGVVQYIN